MSRSVVRRGVPRCPVCRFAWEYCLCPALRTVATPLRITVLAHRQEMWRPTSTGHLIQRVIPAARTRVFQPGTPSQLDDLVDPARELWILHPNGEPLPSPADAAAVHVLLLDGNWRESGRMRRIVESRGRLVQVPVSGPSRYWLRAQSMPGRFSTAEALIFLLEALGRTEEGAVLREQAELLVYAGLLTRGAKGPAAEFLATSPFRARLVERVSVLGRDPSQAQAQAQAWTEAGPGPGRGP